MSGTWTKQGEEPTLETFFADPIVDLLLRRDGLTVQDVRRAIDRARSGGTQSGVTRSGGTRSGGTRSGGTPAPNTSPPCSPRIDEAA